jgi:carboxymethylenebutenolidase
MGATVTFTRPDEAACDGYYAEPPAAAAATPGIVVIQEWWGVNDQIKGVADKLAAAGYRTLVPDLYRGTVTLEWAEANHLMSNLDFVDAAGNDVAGAVAHLKQEGAKVGVLGFCMGGALAVLAGVLTDADAAAAWYGVPPEEAADVTQMRMPLQGHFAQDDGFFTPAAVDALEQKLKSAGKAYEFYRYEAGHAFGNETGAAYNPDCTAQAWERTMDFFARFLTS